MRTVNDCDCVTPSTVSRAVYVPGITHGPSGSHLVLNGVAEIGKEHWVVGRV